METIKPEIENIQQLSINLEELRLPSNYGATIGVKKLLTNVPVGKPRKESFFRTHPSPGMTFPGSILENKAAGESYIVVPDVAQHISELVRPVMLHAAIDRQNNVSLIPVPLPGESGTRNPWHESLSQAVDQAKQKWIRIAPNMGLGVYDTFVAQGELADPEWPQQNIGQLIDIAFRGKVIRSLEHPMVQSLLGRI